MRCLMGRDGRCRALIVALVAGAGACGGGGGGGGPVDAGADEAVTDDVGDDDANDDVSAEDVPAAVCAPASGEITNATCNDVVASGPCVAPVMVDDNAPGPEGGALVAGTYDLDAQIVYTSPGGPTGSAGDPVQQTFVLAGDGSNWSLDEATLRAGVAARRASALTVTGAFMQLRATTTCPDPGAGVGGSGGADGGVPASTLYYTAGDGMLVVYHVGASGPVEADIYRVR